MKKIFILLGLFITPCLLFGQEKLNKLNAPSSPASSILGIQPATILAPKSFQALEATVFSNIVNNVSKGVVPNDFALEVTPYWMTDHKLTLDQYLFPGDIGDQIGRNSSFSLASTQNFLLGDSSSSNSLALGYRTTLFIGNKYDREKIEVYKKNFSQIQRICNDIIQKNEVLFARDEIKDSIDFIEKLKGIINKVIIQEKLFNNQDSAQKFTDDFIKSIKLLPGFALTNNANYLNSVYNVLNTKLNLDIVYKQFESYINARQGIYIDLAYAALINFPTNNFNYSDVPRQSIWITPTYRLKDKLSNLKVMGVIRYEWYNLDYYKTYFPKQMVYENNFDYGLALSGEFKKFTIQFETVGRNSKSYIAAGSDNNGNKLYRIDHKNDLQCIGSFSYNLKDQIILTYSFGNKFEPITNPNQTLVSQLTLNFGFGAPTKSDLLIP